MRLGPRGLVPLIVDAVDAVDGDERSRCLPVPPGRLQPSSGFILLRLRSVSVIKVVITLVRQDGMTPEEFASYWREEHAPLAEQLPHLRRYTISEPLEEDAPIDGIAQLFYDSTETFRASMESDVADRVREDSATFTDADAGQQYVVRETVRVDET